jgi:mono/diheme cytochrome c family protein
MVRIVAWTVVASLGFCGVAAAQGASAAKGAQVYADQKCSLCHSVAGKGNAKGPLDGVAGKMSADEIRSWITSPAEMTKKTNAQRKPPMKAYPNLSKDDVDALVAYIESLKK